MQWKYVHVFFKKGLNCSGIFIRSAQRLVQIYLTIRWIKVVHWRWAGYVDVCVCRVIQMERGMG